MSPPPKFCTAVTLPASAPVSSRTDKADEIGVVELVLFLCRQDGAVDKKRGSRQPFGDGAVANSLETHDDDVSGRPDILDLEGAAVLGVERAVVAKRQRIAGEGFHAQLALDAVGGADDGHLDGILRLHHKNGFTSC